MSTNRLFRRRRLAILLPLVPMLTLQVLPILSLAQQNPQDPAPTDRNDRNGQGQTDKDKTQDTEPTNRNAKTKATPPPPNPLVIFDPATGTGNNPKAFDKRGNRTADEYTRRPDFGNFRETPRDVRDDAKKKTEELPYFGYYFFEPTRQLILARRSYYQSLYAVDNSKRRTANTNRSYGPVYREGRDSMTNSPLNPDGKQPNQGKVRLDRDGYPISDVPFRAKPGEVIAPAFGEKRTERRRTNVDRDATGADPQLLRRRSGEPLDPMDEPYYDEYGDEMIGEEDEYAYPIETNDTGYENDARRRRSLRDQDVDTLYFNSRQSRPTLLEDDIYSPRSLTTRERMLQDTARRNAVQRDMTLSSVGAAPNGRPRTNVDSSSLNAFTNVADPLSQIFRNVAASAPSFYQLAPGDKLTVRYSAPTLTSRENNLNVDTQGAVDIEGMGRIIVRGMTLEQAEKAISARLKKLYKNPTVTVSLRELRTITVNAGGDIFEPGPYTLPAVASAFNLLQAAGGPTYDGSLRRIEVHRNGKIIGTLDFYQMMRSNIKKDGTSYDIRLQNGDTVYVPPRESTITLAGEVRTPAIYELKEGENLTDLIRYSGGIKPSGVIQSVQVNTVDPGRSRVLKTVDVKKPGEGEKFELYDGDSVDVFSVRQTVVNKVTIEGAVESPGDYAINEGMTIYDLLIAARGALSEASLNQAELYRWNPDNTTTLVTVDLTKVLTKDPKENMELKRWDRLKLYTRQQIAFTGFRKVEVRGAVQYPGIYERSKNMHVADILRQVGGPTPDAFLENAILMHQYGDGKTKYEEINISEALKDNPKHNVMIEDNDLLSLYKVGEAKFVPDGIVHIKGFVNAPGIYKRGEGMKLSQLLRIAGGFTPKAGSEVTVAHARRVLDGVNADFSKKVTIAFDSQGRCAPHDDVVLDDGDVVTIQGTGGFVDKVPTITVKGAVNKPGPIVLTSKNMRLSDAIKEAGGMRAEAFPEGAAFFRDPELLDSPGQAELVKAISELFNLFNDGAYRSALAKSDIARAQALSQVTQEGALSIPGMSQAPQANAAGAVFASELSKRETVTRPRNFTDRELTPNGVIAINLPDAMKRPLGDADIQLMDGDTIEVPEIPTTISVRGAVLNQRGVLYREREGIEYYLAQAGGLAPDAEKKNIVILRRNGGTLPINKVKTLRPGDLILVPNRVLSERIGSKPNAFDSLFRSLTSTALMFRLFGL